MSFFPEIRFSGFSSSEALDASARRHATRLARSCPAVTGCRVGIEFRRSRRHGGPEYAVHVDVDLPGHEIGVDRTGEDDALAVLRAAFEDVERRVEDATHGGTRARPAARRAGAAGEPEVADETALAEGDPLDATDSPDEGMTGE